MTDNSRRYRRRPDEAANDTRLITPLVLMGLIITCGLLFFAYSGDRTAPAVTQAPAAQTTR